MTRVITFLMSREVSARTYPRSASRSAPPAVAPPERAGEAGEVRQDQPTTSHLRALPREAAGDARRRRHAARSLTLLYGSGISDSNLHTHDNLPILRRRRRGIDQGRPPRARRAGHAADEPAADAARQGGRAGGRLGDSTRVAWWQGSGAAGRGRRCRPHAGALRRSRPQGLYQQTLHPVGGGAGRVRHHYTTSYRQEGWTAPRAESARAPPARGRWARSAIRERRRRAALRGRGGRGPRATGGRGRAPGGGGRARPGIKAMRRRCPAPPPPARPHGAPRPNHTEANTPASPRRIPPMGAPAASPPALQLTPPLRSPSFIFTPGGGRAWARGPPTVIGKRAGGGGATKGQYIRATEI